MQFLRDSLSFSFSSQQGNNRQAAAAAAATQDPTIFGGNGAVKDDGAATPTASQGSDGSKYDTVRSRVPVNLGSPPSAYSTPFQSPIIASRTFPTLTEAASTLGNRGPARAGSMAPTLDGGKPERSSKVYFIDQGQLQPPEYELPERPSALNGDGGIVNPAFTNDSSGATMINMSGSQPSVIREQYWTWSCRCPRELTPREKGMLIVIFILVLIVGGLATYLGIVVDSDGDVLPGGILTNNRLVPAAATQE
ncbi:uncharacterized protein LOC126573225 [Anopheles aquasalis]|uniref:uncharacterized protein LOC126573225 n=1 Tax=Anopheles aquasalis TaxID=42839 RepID=UPI00215B0766|nr:uncharacterized protein LOC126573225 [Anopheles aquasalis]